MSISRFNLPTSSSDMQSLYDFLNANKAGTFLENATIEISETKSTLTISSANATFTINTGSIARDVVFATFSGNITSTLYAKAGATSITSIKGALLCNNGLIIETNVYMNADHISPEIALTVDSTGELAVIFKNAAWTLASSSSAVASILGYRVTDTNSSSEATVTLIPQYEAQKTSLAPIVPICNDNSILLPYAYAALHTQAASQGVQAMRMNGSNYITNGVWYIKDGE